jgi:hypothetical protein
MVASMVNRFAYKPSVKDIVHKYCEMFRGKKSANKQDLFKGLGTYGSTGLRRSGGSNEEECVVGGRNQSVTY